VNGDDISHPWQRQLIWVVRIRLVDIAHHGLLQARSTRRSTQGGHAAHTESASVHSTAVEREEEGACLLNSTELAITFGGSARATVRQSSNTEWQRSGVHWQRPEEPLRSCSEPVRQSQLHALEFSPQHPCRCMPALIHSCAANRRFLYDTQQDLGTNYQERTLKWMALLCLCALLLLHQPIQS